MENSAKNLEIRFDDLVRSERYFTATLLPTVLFHNKLEGVRRFVDLVEKNAKTEHYKDGKQLTKRDLKYDFDDVEVITEFHIARDLKFYDRKLDVTAWGGGEVASAEPPHEARDVEPSEEDEPRKDAPDVVIVSGQELVVCEGKFFDGFNIKGLNEQLCSQRRQVRHLFLNRQIRAYRHVAILPYVPTMAVDADAVIKWGDIATLAEDFMPNHYVTVRLRNAVGRYPEDDPGIFFDGKLSFDDMRKKCREFRDLGKEIYVGHAGGEAALLKWSLLEAESKLWKWRQEKTKGKIILGNWLSGERWLEIVESTRGFGRGGV